MIFFNFLFNESSSKIYSTEVAYGWLLFTYAVETWHHTRILGHAWANLRIFMAPRALILIFKSTLISKSTDAALFMTTSISPVILSKVTGSIPRLSSTYSIMINFKYSRFVVSNKSKTGRFNLQYHQRLLLFYLWCSLQNMESIHGICRIKPSWVFLYWIFLAVSRLSIQDVYYVWVTNRNFNIKSNSKWSTFRVSIEIG